MTMVPWVIHQKPVLFAVRTMSKEMTLHGRKMSDAVTRSTQSALRNGLWITMIAQCVETYTW